MTGCRILANVFVIIISDSSNSVGGGRSGGNCVNCELTAIISVIS